LILHLSILFNVLSPAGEVKHMILAELPTIISIYVHLLATGNHKRIGVTFTWPSDYSCRKYN